MRRCTVIFKRKSPQDIANDICVRIKKSIKERGLTWNKLGVADPDRVTAETAKGMLPETGDAVALLKSGVDFSWLVSGRARNERFKSFVEKESVRGRPKNNFKAYRKINSVAIRTAIGILGFTVKQFCEQCQINRSVIHEILSGTYYSPRVCELMREKLGMDESDFYLPGNQVDTLAQYNRLRKFGFAVEPPTPATDPAPEVTP